MLQKFGLFFCLSSRLRARLIVSDFNYKRYRWTERWECPTTLMTSSCLTTRTIVVWSQSHLTLYTLSKTWSDAISSLLFVSWIYTWRLSAIQMIVEFPPALPRTPRSWRRMGEGGKDLDHVIAVPRTGQLISGEDWWQLGISSAEITYLGALLFSCPSVKSR